MPIVSLPVLVRTGLSLYGWDLHVYANALRSLQTGHDPHAIVEFLLFFLALQFLSGNAAAVWKPLVGIVLSGLYVAGAWQLFVLSRTHETQKVAPSVA